MEKTLNNKIAVVTGSSAGIGLASARKLHQLGATVVLNGRSLDKLKELKEDLLRRSKATASILTVAADLGSAEGVDIFVKEIPHCDILVNNLGIYEPKPFENIADADWMKHWEVNVMSGVRLSRYYLKGMRKKNWGRIIFISSESALQIPVEMIHYGVTKTAQVALAKGIAELTSGTNITANSLLVGPTFTEGVKGFIESMAKEQGITAPEAENEFFHTIRPTSLLKRFIKPEEVANFVAFLSSEEASAVNGSALRIDGGVVKSII